MDHVVSIAKQIRLFISFIQPRSNLMWSYLTHTHYVTLQHYLVMFHICSLSFSQF